MVTNNIHTETNLEVFVKGLLKYIDLLLPPDDKELKGVLENFLEKPLDIRHRAHIQQIATANLHVTVLKFNEGWGLCYGFSNWNFLENFQNSFVKEQLHFHVVGTFEETDESFKDLIRSA